MKLLQGQPSARPLHSAFRHLEHGMSLLSLYWTRRLWIILIWACGIPLSTIGFVTMLFWAYGAND